MSCPNGKYRFLTHPNEKNRLHGECNIICHGDSLSIKFHKSLVFNPTGEPTNELSFKHSSGSSYIQTSPRTLNPLILDIKTMYMSFVVAKSGKSSDIVCVFEKGGLRENFTSDCCSARAKFVDLKNTWTKQGSTNKTTWLPYNTRGKSLVQKDVKEDYCSSCNGYRYSPNIFTGTTISNTTPRDQLWKTVPLTDRTVLNGIAYPGIQPQQISDNHNIYNISSRYNSNTHRNPMRYPMRYPTNVNDCDSPSHYKELNHTYCKD